MPIFFTLSGFLIYWSFDNNPNIKTFFFNRFLRIFPALICALIICIGLLFLFDILSFEKILSASFIMWLGTQLTFLQEFTPSILHGFGGSIAPNAVLWTISVEMLLYISIPIFYIVTLKFKRNWKAIFYLCLGLISYCQNQTGFISDFLGNISDNGYYLIFIHPICQIISFLWFFCIGIEVFLFRDKIIPFLSNKALPILTLYLVLCCFAYCAGFNPGSYSPYSIELITHFVLVGLIFSFAYTLPHLTVTLIGKTDISYGLYIYHMMIIHTFSELGLRDNMYILPCIFISLFVAWLSWTLVEKKVLKLKKYSLYKSKAQIDNVENFRKVIIT